MFSILLKRKIFTRLLEFCFGRVRVETSVFGDTFNDGEWKIGEDNYEYHEYLSKLSLNES